MSSEAIYILPDCDSEWWQNKPLAQEFLTDGKTSGYLVAFRLMRLYVEAGSIPVRVTITSLLKPEETANDT